jgi:hypothetical protein
MPRPVPRNATTRYPLPLSWANGVAGYGVAHALPRSGLAATYLVMARRSIGAATASAMPPFRVCPACFTLPRLDTMSAYLSGERLGSVSAHVPSKPVTEPGGVALLRWDATS